MAFHTTYIAQNIKEIKMSKYPKRIQEIIDNREKSEKDIRQALENVNKAHNDVVESYEEHIRNINKKILRRI